MGGGRGAGDVAAHRLAAHPGRRIKREEAVLGIARLFLELIEGDAAPIDPSRGTGLEALRVETQGLQGFREPIGSLLAGATGGHGTVAHPDAAAEEGAGGEDHRIGAVDTAEIGAHADHPAALARGALQFEAGHHGLP